jgi:hypothetical protein
MGGFNSGRSGGKRTTGDMCALDIRRLARDGLLARGTAFLWTWSRGDEKVGSIQVWPVERDRVRLIYRTRDYGAADWKDMDYSVRVVWTDCALGGQRAWWQCPAVRCGRRVAVLYGGGVYACRHCHNLAYRTQREQIHDRARSKADKIRKRLGWEAGILNADGGKPKGMHWATFMRLQALHDANVNRSMAGISAKFGRIFNRMPGVKI